MDLVQNVAVMQEIIKLRVWIKKNAMYVYCRPTYLGHAAEILVPSKVQTPSSSIPSSKAALHQHILDNI